MQKRWNILGADEQKIDHLKQSLGISRVICQVLVQRGIQTFDQAKSFFRPALTDLHDPWQMKDMDKAVSRIKSAFNSKEKILVFGDYDVDGTTAVASMYRFISSVYTPDLTDFYIPHRYREGYGVSKQGIDYANSNGCTLIISLDCGIKSVELVRYANSLGIDFIICDHHLPDKELPPAIAILNPKQPDCEYPYKELCGCGVGFKLITALAMEMGMHPEHSFEFLDLVATAIAADIVPLTGENRVLAYFGLQKANENPNHGIRAIKNLNNFEKDLQITNLVFMIAPRVNAAGRMDDARKAVEMFIAPTYKNAMEYAAMLTDDNEDRRKADKSITEEALCLISKDESLLSRKTTVLYQSHWHKGVVGIVASRLIDHYYRPTIILTQSGDYAAGSARSVSGFNVYEAIHQCRELLLGYGGHFYAAGMTLEIDKVPAFQKLFEEVVAASITPDLLVPEIIIDAEVSLADLTPAFYNILNQMEPFGPENLRPVFLVRNCSDRGSAIVKECHIRFCITHGNTIFTGIGFNMYDKFEILQSGRPFDLVFTLEENEWKNSKQLQLRVMDIRYTHEKTPDEPGLQHHASSTILL